MAKSRAVIKRQEQLCNMTITRIAKKYLALNTDHFKFIKETRYRKHSIFVFLLKAYLRLLAVSFILDIDHK